MEERLRYIFQLVNDSQRFAEAKNAALVLAIGAFLKPVMDHFPEAAEPAGVRVFGVAGCFTLVLSALVSLTSFIPRLTSSQSPGKQSAQCVTDNLFYFGHISKYSAFDFLEALYRATGQKPSNSRTELDLAGQIVVNSGIAFRKFRQFTIAVVIALVGVAFFVISAVCYLCK